jgi:hypothetical protein
MFTRFSRNLVRAVAIFSVLAGCAHTPPPPIADGAPPPGAVVAEPTRAGGVNEFCSQYEWACILAGLAAFGATVAIIDGTSD